MADQTASPSKGWVVTIAGLCINLALGVLYTWSIFTAKFTTVLTMGAGGVVQKKGEVLAGAAPIAAADAAQYGLKLAEGAKTASGFYVSALAKPTNPEAGYKTVSVAKTVLAEHAYGWTALDALAPYALALLFFAFTMVFAGRLQDKYGPRIVASVGGLFVGAGMIVASFSDYSAKGNHMPLILGFGVLTGIGIGLAYACATPAAVKWFHPSKRGLISGLVVAGFGLASVYTAPLTTQMIASIGLNGTFLYLGIGFLIAIIAFSQLLQNPPAGYTPAVPAGFEAKETKTQADVVTHIRDYDWPQMVKTVQFYLLWLMYGFAAFAGLMMTGLIGKVAPELLSPADYAAMSSAEFMGIAMASGFLLVMALAVGNGAGRPLIGIVSDRIGRVPSMIIVFLLQALLVALILPNSHSLAMLLVVAAGIGACYGANLALFPAATYDFFGTKHGGVNYGLVFTAWGVGGALGNYAAGWIKDATGTFTPAYYVAAALLVVAAVLALTVKAPKVEAPAVEAAPQVA
jgi:OFA family oxalate/formate antiporter-like MFS transporter